MPSTNDCLRSPLNDSTDVYQEALNKSGYNYQLKYNPISDKTKKRNRQHNIICYNPPFSSNAKTNIGKDKDKALHKIFNRNTVKIGNSCIPNVKTIIDNHNTTLCNQQKQENNTADPPCNSRKKDKCPLQGECRAPNIIYMYQATVMTENSTDTCRTD